MLFLPGVAAAVAIVAADESSAGGYASCMNSNVCMPISDIPVWWVCMQGKAPEYLILAGAMIFFATFLPRVLLSFMLFILSKFPFVREIVDDYVKFCTTSTTYLLSASLCMGATIVALLSPYLCRFHIYVWGIFFLMWIYSVFNVIDRVPSMYIYLQMWQDQSLLKYSFLGMIGGAIALGFAGATHNAVGGLYLVLNAPFRVDEFIQVGQVQGHVQRVALRFTVVLGLDRTKIFVPNSYFLYKPMRQIALDIHVHPHTSVAVLETLVRDLHVMSRHMGLTSHDDYNGPADKAKFCFVTMDALYSIRLYTYTDELDAKKHAMIRSEVWLAAMEIMEDLGVVTVPSAHSPDHDKPARDDQEHGPCAAEYGFVL
ncbi:hypothetical protein DYB32_009459 [Aphanomyces invadans]|uniref:Mechanosensitive ion channel MscS domain-containing protein n=1 Tax=Aphanomyces invadans TaxID=157072 RepID=A0A418AIU3_9STRA|nr:hypothetical protein DYB32_009459 [Aphanomyces invadans]